MLSVSRQNMSVKDQQIQRVNCGNAALNLGRNYFSFGVTKRSLRANEVLETGGKQLRLPLVVTTSSKEN